MTVILDLTGSILSMPGESLAQDSLIRCQRADIQCLAATPLLLTQRREIEVVLLSRIAKRAVLNCFWVAKCGRLEEGFTLGGTRARRRVNIAPATLGRCMSNMRQICKCTDEMLTSSTIRSLCNAAKANGGCSSCYKRHFDGSNRA